MRTFLRGLIRYHRGLARLPLSWKPWLLVLLTLNMIVPWFYLTRTEAQVIFGTALLGGATFSLLTGLFGFTRIIWAAHVVWVPLIAWLCFRLTMVADDAGFAWWLRLVIIADLIALVFDGANVIRYLRGDRAEMVPGLP
jgi:hypothetical protein